MPPLSPHERVKGGRTRSGTSRQDHLVVQGVNGSVQTSRKERVDVVLQRVEAAHPVHSRSLPLRVSRVPMARKRRRQHVEELRGTETHTKKGANRMNELWRRRPRHKMGTANTRATRRRRTAFRSLVT